MKKIMIVFLVLCAAHVSAQKTPGVFNPATFFKSFTSKTAEVRDINMHYVIGGKGPLIVLIHGWPECWYEWRKMMPLLAQHYTVISVDLRGAGESSVTTAGYDKKNLAGDVHQLLEQLGYKKYAIVGHDWGAAHKLQMPVLAIGGDVQAKDEVAKVMRNVAVNVKQVVMKNTGHFIAEERPGEFVDLITNFLR